MRFTSSLKLKLIYVFRIHDAAHHGCLKIGEATCEDENVFGLSPNSKASMKRQESVSTNTHRRQASHTICYIRN